MRDNLAEALLAKVMGWSPEDVSIERPDIQALADLKYDEYQQFSPGMRFIESLALWINQFQQDEKKIAYEFIKKRLIFISNSEMMHLVSISFPDHISSILAQKVSVERGLPSSAIGKIYASREYDILRRQCLFLGLSDGAHTDIFRRSNPNISHEQVLQTYDLSIDKARELVQKLKEDIEKKMGRAPSEKDSKFKFLVLIDDFSGSGHSYFTKKDGGEYGGKIFKIFSKVFDSESLYNLVDKDNLHILILLYVSTSHAISHLLENIESWQKETGNNCTFSIVPIQIVPDSAVVKYEPDDPMIKILEKYFDSDLTRDCHYRTGSHERPYLGYDECALPLILAHNTPNNSLPLLWFESERDCRGLFPRVSRHRGEL